MLGYQYSIWWWLSKDRDGGEVRQHCSNADVTGTDSYAGYLYADEAILVWVSINYNVTSIFLVWNPTLLLNTEWMSPNNQEERPPV